MNAIMEHTQGLSLLVNVNWDRLLYLALVLFALSAGAWIGSVAF